MAAWSDRGFCRFLLGGRRSFSSPTAAWLPPCHPALPFSLSPLCAGGESADTGRLVQKAEDVETPPPGPSDIFWYDILIEPINWGPAHEAPECTNFSLVQNLENDGRIQSYLFWTFMCEPDSHDAWSLVWNCSGHILLSSFQVVLFFSLFLFLLALLWKPHLISSGSIHLISRSNAVLLCVLDSRYCMLMKEKARRSQNFL